MSPGTRTSGSALAGTVHIARDDASPPPPHPHRRASTQDCEDTRCPSPRRHSPSPHARGEGRGEGQRGALRSHALQVNPRDVACSKDLPLTRLLPLTLTLSPFRSAARGEGTGWYAWKRVALRRLAWMPASAGVTKYLASAPHPSNVIPAKAGIHASFGSITMVRGRRRPSLSPRARGEGRGEGQRSALRSHHLPKWISPPRQTSHRQCPEHRP